MSNKVKVVIAGEMRAMFHQVVEMDKAEFDLLDTRLDSDERPDRRRASNDIEAYIDFADILDLDGFELGEFRIVGDDE